MKIPETVKWKSTGKTLGEGGQGIVREVIDTTSETQQTYALKALSKGKPRKAYERFIREEAIIMVHPEFESIEFSYEETPSEAEKKNLTYSEEFHLEGVGDNVKEIYHYLKAQVQDIDASFIMNPQKYYISIKAPKNIAYMKIRKKKIRIIVMLPEEEIRASIMKHSIKSLSESVQKYYNGPCAAVDIHDLQDIQEIINLLKRVMKETSVETVLIQ